MAFKDAETALAWYVKVKDRVAQYSISSFDYATTPGRDVCGEGLDDVILEMLDIENCLKQLTKRDMLMLLYLHLMPVTKVKKFVARHWKKPKVSSEFMHTIKYKALDKLEVKLIERGLVDDHNNEHCESPEDGSGCVLNTLG